VGSRKKTKAHICVAHYQFALRRRMIRYSMDLNLSLQKGLVR